MMVMVTMPVSVMYNGNVKKPNNVAYRRYGLRNLNRLTFFLTSVMKFVIFP